MKTLVPVLLALLLPGFHSTEDFKVSPLPSPVSNNAVALYHEGKEGRIYSFMGIGAKKTWDAATSQAYELDLSSGKWEEIHAVPGVSGRLAASAVAIKEQVFLLGGYVIDGKGGEHTLSDVNVYVPLDHRWFRGDDIPTPVDDSVVGVYRDRYIFLISGWSKTDAVHDVQIYDTNKNKWLQGTPIAGTPVFGHAGAIVGDTIVYVDGAYRNPDGTGAKYSASSECWMGKLNKSDVTKIEWSKLPPHPGAARYRIAAGAGEREGRIYFSGGTDNPYNFNGVGYNGQPSEPSPVTFAFNVRSGKWETITDNTPDPTMDHRGLAVVGHNLVIIGGMERGQQVTSKVTIVKTTAGK